MVPFWVQMKGVPLYLSSDKNMCRFEGEIKGVMEVEDLAYTRGFLKVMIDTSNPLPAGWTRTKMVRDM